MTAFSIYEVSWPFCDLTWSVKGRTNAGLLLLASLLYTTFWLQLFVTLERPSEVGNKCVSILQKIKVFFIDLADYYYFMMDVALSMGLIVILSILSMLPLLWLQSSVLFNRDFAKVIQTKLSRAALLKRILD